MVENVFGIGDKVVFVGDAGVPPRVAEVVGIAGSRITVREPDAGAAGPVHSNVPASLLRLASAEELDATAGDRLGRGP